MFLLESRRCNRHQYISVWNIDFGDFRLKFVGEILLKRRVYGLLSIK